MIKANAGHLLSAYYSWVYVEPFTLRLPVYSLQLSCEVGIFYPHLHMWTLELREVRKFASVHIVSVKMWFGLKSMLITRVSSQNHYALLPFMHLAFSNCLLH